MRLSCSRIKPIGAGAKKDWSHMPHPERKKRNPYKVDQFVVGRHFSFSFERVDDIHQKVVESDCSYCNGEREIETDNNGPIVECPICAGGGKRNKSRVFGRVGDRRVMKSGEAVGVGPGGSTVGRWVCV